MRQDTLRLVEQAIMRLEQGGPWGSPRSTRGDAGQSPV